MSVVDKRWELIDPNPNIHELFLQFNDQFFYSKLGSVYVEWSQRMTRFVPIHISLSFVDGIDRSSSDVQESVTIGVVVNVESL